MSSENTISYGLTQLLLGKASITSSMTRNTIMSTINSGDQWHTRRPTISVPDTVVQLVIENSLHLEQSSPIIETSTSTEQPLVTRNTLVYTKPIINLAPVIGTKMHLSFVKMAIPACKVLLAPLTKCNAELIFLSGLGGRYLHWVFNYVAASKPAFEEPGEHIPEDDAEEEMTEDGSVSFLEHNLKCQEYKLASEAQGELELMLKEAMDDNIFTTTVFTKFPHLAPEIQDMIWDFATEEKRIIEVHLWKRCAEWMIIYASTDAKNPPILSVCKAARERGLLKYKVLTVNNSWRRDKKMYDDNQEKLGLPLNFIGPEASATNFRCYINYDRDTIFINTEHSRANEDVFPSGTQTWREAFGYQFLKDLYFSSAGDRVKNIAIDYRVAEKWLDTGRRNWQYCQVFAAMPLLTKLEIVWADHQGLDDLIEKECCTRKYMVVEGAPKPLANEDRYGAKFPCEGLHRRVKNFKEICSSAGDQRDNCAFELFASSKTSATWKENIMSAVRDNRPRNSVGADPFHFVGGKSRYRDLDDLNISQVCVEREKKEANWHETSCNH